MSNETNISRARDLARAVQSNVGDPTVRVRPLWVAPTGPDATAPKTSVKNRFAGAMSYLLKGPPPPPPPPPPVVEPPKPALHGSMEIRLTGSFARYHDRAKRFEHREDYEFADAWTDVKKFMRELELELQ